MNHLFRGKRIDQSELPKALDLLESTIEKDLLLPPLDCEIVISAMECLLKESHLHAYDQELIASVIPTWKTHQFMEAIIATIYPQG